MNFRVSTYFGMSLFALMTVFTSANMLTATNKTSLDTSTHLTKNSVTLANRWLCWLASKRSHPERAVYVIHYLMLNVYIFFYITVRLQPC